MSDIDPEEIDFSQFEADSYSLSGMQREISEAESKELDDVTVEFGFNSPDNFSHKWTLENVQTYSDYLDEMERTREAAYRRLKNAWWDKDEESLSKFKNEVDLEPRDIPVEVMEFEDAKKKKKLLEDVVVPETEQVYQKSGDRYRNISIGQRLSNKSNNLKEYRENLKKVNQNLDFEDELSIDEEGDVFEEDRQKTTGDITWVNDQGQQVRTLVFSTGVEFQVGGVGADAEYKREFDDKKEAKQFYKENRLA
jgi:hypothetical protein